MLTGGKIKRACCPDNAGHLYWVHHQDRKTKMRMRSLGGPQEAPGCFVLYLGVLGRIFKVHLQSPSKTSIPVLNIALLKSLTI